MKIKRIISCFVLVFVLFSLIPDFCFSVKAEDNGLVGGQSNIVNGGFEAPDLKTANPNVNWKNTNKDNVPGWETTSTDGIIEFGWMLEDVPIQEASSHMKPTITTEVIGEGASDGYQFAETVADEAGSIYQSLSLSADSYYSWTVHHRGRQAVDTIALIITDDANINYVKPSKTSTDHFYQITNWMKANGVTEPEAGTMIPYTVILRN